MLTYQIAQCCKTLKLGSSLARNSETVETDDRQQYLLELLRMEIAGREKAKTERLIQKAGFPARKELKDFVYDEVKVPSGLTPAVLESGDFIANKENLILYGNVGTGKTHLAAALGLEACRKGRKVGFYRTAALVNRLTEAREAGVLSKKLAEIHKLDLIILDEWGYVPMDRTAAQLLFEVVSDSYERRSVILTTNLEFSRWVSLFYDEQMTAAMIDRLVHHSYILLFDGSSNRVRNSTARG